MGNCTDKESLLAIQAHLREEIGWRSKTCMYTWYFLVLATGTGVSYLLDRCFFSNEKPLPDPYLAGGFLAISLVWVVGLFYLLEKRSWITFIGHYLRAFAEPRLYSENTREGLHGWELHSFLIKQKRKLGVGDIETLGALAVIVCLGVLDVAIIRRNGVEINRLCWLITLHCAVVVITVTLYFWFRSRKKVLEKLWPSELATEAKGGQTIAPHKVDVL